MELTPLIDVVFILLIFFIVSTKFQKDELALLLELPETQEGAGQGKKEESIVVEVSADSIAYQGKKIAIEDLGRQLQTLDKKVLVQLRIDQNVRYKRVALFLDLFQKYQIQNMSLITQKK